MPGCNYSCKRKGGSTVLPVLKHLNPSARRRVLWRAHWLLIQQKTDLPRPVSFALVASMAMFALLPAMPAHPMSIPVVIGAGMIFALLWRFYEPAAKISA